MKTERAIAETKLCQLRCEEMLKLRERVAELEQILISQEQLEKELLKRLEMYTQILDAIPDLVTSKNSRSRLVYANKAYRDFHGLNRSWSDCGTVGGHRESTPDSVVDDTYIFNTGQVVRLSKESVTRYDGQLYWHETVKVPIFNAEGTVVNIVETCHVVPQFAPSESGEIEVNAEPEIRVEEQTNQLTNSLSYLHSEIADYQQAEQSLQNLIAGTASVTGKEFYPAFAQHLAAALGVRYVIVAEASAWEGETPVRAKVLAFWAKGKLGENFEYDLVNTPCESIFTQETLVENHGISCYPSNVQSYFPKGEALKALGGECFLGVALQDTTSGKPIGHICFIDNKPLIQEQRAKAIMSIFAARVTAELERQQAEAALQQEIEERLQAEEALRASEQRFRSLSACSPVGIFLADIHGHYTYTNPRCQEICGFTFEEALGEGWARSLHPDERQRVVADWVATVRVGRQYSDEFRLLSPAGILRWVRVRSSPMFSDKGELVGSVGTVEDITEAKRVESEICKTLEKEKNLSELKSRFITTTSHEFRTPLSVISSSAAFIENYGDKVDSAKKLKHFQRLQSSVKYMTQLLEDVILINKAEVGKLDFNPAPLDLVEFCRDLIEELQVGIKTDSKISLNIDCADCALARTYMDEKLLRIILSNLISNAIKYSPASSTVYFDLSCDKAVVFQVRDEGIGIPPEDLQHLFELFHRATNVGNIPGTGLGLAIVKKCVELHRGEISVQRGVGRGATFTVTIPLKI